MRWRPRTIVLSLKVIWRLVIVCAWSPVVHVDCRSRIVNWLFTPGRSPSRMVNLAYDELAQSCKKLYSGVSHAIFLLRLFSYSVNNIEKEIINRSLTILLLQKDPLSFSLHVLYFVGFRPKVGTMAFSDRVGFVIPNWRHGWEIIAFFNYYKVQYPSKMKRIFQEEENSKGVRGAIFRKNF